MVLVTIFYHKSAKQGKTKWGNFFATGYTVERGVRKHMAETEILLRSIADDYTESAANGEE